MTTELFRYLGNVQIGQIFEFVESIAAKHRPFSIGLRLAWGITKDPTVWLDGARSPPKYVFKNNMSLENLKIWPT